LEELRPEIVDSVVQVIYLQKMSAEQSLLQQETFKDKKAILEYDIKKLEEATEKA